MMTYIDWPHSVARKALQNSTPSMTGISQSVTIICGMISSAMASASAPLQAEWTFGPTILVNTASIIVLDARSSSTNNTRIDECRACDSALLGTGADAMAANEGKVPAGTLSISLHSRHWPTMPSIRLPCSLASRPSLPPSSISSEMMPPRSASGAKPMSAMRLP